MSSKSTLVPGDLVLQDEVFCILLQHLYEADGVELWKTLQVANVVPGIMNWWITPNDPKCFNLVSLRIRR